MLALIQAGGIGGRMDVLTRERAKPALPFAGVYQLVDFPLSNLTHSGITDVWLSLQFQGATLEEQVAQRPPVGPRPQPRRPAPADARAGHRQPRRGGLRPGQRRRAVPDPRQIAAEAPDVVLVLSADHVYRARLQRGHRRPPRGRRRVHRRDHRGAPRAGRRPRGRGGRGRRPGHRLRLQARGPDGRHDRGRGDRLRPARPGRRAGGAAPRARRRADAGDTGLGDFGDHLSRGWSSAARRTPPRWAATGATWASRTTTCARTTTC